MLTTMQRFVELNGRFTLSDDSHGVEQVGLNFPRVIAAIRRAGINEIVYLDTIGSSDSQAIDERFKRVCWTAMTLDQLESHDFWKVQ
jgi:histidinol-phosphatase (PHP family)